MWLFSYTKLIGTTYGIPLLTQARCPTLLVARCILHSWVFISLTITGLPWSKSELHSVHL